MLRLATAAFLAAGPAFADINCDDYKRIVLEAAERVRQETECHDMARDAWEACMTTAFLAGEPSVIAFIALIEDVPGRPEIMACP